MAVLVRFWAAARAAAGTSEREYVGCPDLGALLTAVAADGGPELAAVLAVSSFLVDAAPVGTRPHGEVALRPGSVVEVLPPFAGG